MKIKITLLALSLFLFTNIYSQKIESILSSKITEIEKIEVKSADYIAHLNFDFGKSKILNPKTYLKINGAVITKIQLVYTEFSSNAFDQRRLNKKRLEALQKLDGTIMTNNLIKWELVSQKGSENAEESKEYFHGFIIYFKPRQTAETIKKEVTVFRDILVEMDEILESEKQIKDSSLDSIEYFIPKLSWSAYESLFPSSFYSYTSGKKDTVVLAVLERNIAWENSLVVVDLTGSMSPYYTQLFIWLKLNDNLAKMKYFVVFNDGDDKPTKKKKIGKTEGIYMTEVDDFDGLSLVTGQSFEGGSGGDGPENDIEAILTGIKKYDDYDQIILIADNFANMRDYELIDDIGKPVRVIMCGATELINTQYLDLARKTGGSIHTIESDVEGLIDISEGETIEIGEAIYKIEKGKFQLLESL